MKIKELIAVKIERAFGLAGISGPAIVKTTSNPELGDYQVNGVMAAAKKANIKPDDLALQIIKLADLDEIASKVSFAKPGFINIVISPKFLGYMVPGEISQITHEETVVVDYSAPNLAKEMHVGHLRSTIIGDSMARVLEAKGYKTIRQNHVGDWGTQFGMLLTYMADSGHDSALLSDLEDFYRQAKKQFDSEPEFSVRSRQAVVNLQSGSPYERTHWNKFIEISMAHCQQIYKKLRVSLEQRDVKGESSFNEMLPTIIESLETKDLIKNSEGAKCVFLKDFKAPLIVQKSDGGYLYSTTDLAAIRYRTDKLEANRILYFVDSRQSLHFRQVFSVAQSAGLNSSDASLEHMAFGTMLNEDGKPFKTREGGLIKLMPLINEAIRRGTKTVLEKNPEMTIEEASLIGESIGIAAIKYADLSKNRTNDYVFNWDQMLSLEGNTAPYLLYAYTRIQRLIMRSGIPKSRIQKETSPSNEIERLLCVEIVKLDDVVHQVAMDGYPHFLCNYLYSLATRFNQFYETCEILNSSEETKKKRLSIASSSGTALRKGLDLLGIEVVQKM